VPSFFCIKFFEKNMIDIKKLPRTEFASAVAQVAGQRRIDPNAVIEAVRNALVAAYKKDARERGEEMGEDEEYDVSLDSDSGEAKIFKIDGEKRNDVTPPGFGRIAAQTAKQVIVQKIREAEKESIFQEYSSKVGTLLSGTILRLDPFKAVVGIGKAEAILPREEQVRGERYEPTKKMTFLFKEIAESEDKKEMILSRRDPHIVEELFKREVPEVALGNVVIKKIARRPGSRTKIAVESVQSGIDPVGSCVGQNGVRVQAVMEDLEKEKIDIIPYSENLNQFVLSALSPAEGTKVKDVDEEENTILVTVPEDKLALAIGARGENVKLASELVGYEIKVIGEETGKKGEMEEEEKKDIEIEVKAKS